MSSCVIRLDNYQGQYNAGDSIKGKVICSFDKSKDIRGIILQLKGEERNCWSHWDRGNNVYRRGHKTFLYVENILHGEGQIGSGRYEYPFTFQLPHHLPSTYQGHYGGVTFTLDVKVDRPFQSDYTDSMNVTVASPINFNLMKDKLQLEPATYSVDKTICCWCCASGPITMEVHLEKEAFVVGDVAKLRVDINNRSNESVESVTVNLTMKVTSRISSFKSTGRSDRELLATSSYTGVGSYRRRSYNVDLEIPRSTQVPNFDLCELFSQKTKLEVTAVLPKSFTNLKAVANITLGHIPIDGFSQNRGYLPNTHPPNTEGGKLPYAPGPMGTTGL